MIKKITKYICLAVMTAAMFSISTVSAANVDTYNQKEAVVKLNKLGITVDAASKSVTKDDFINSLSGFFYDEDVVTNAESIARMTGMVEENESYNGKEKIDVITAVKYAVIALGYKPTVENTDGAYVNCAGEIGITDGIKVSDKELFSTKTWLMLLENMLDAEPLVKEYKGNDINYTVKSGESLLSINRGIYKVNGLQTANSVTSIYTQDGVGEGKISIDQNTYDADDVEDFIGENITAYIKDDNGDKTVLYTMSRSSKNTITTITDEQIESVKDDFSGIEYYNASGNLKTAKMEAAVSVIYNGVLYDEYTKEDLIPDVGEVKLIDNNGNGSADVVIVTSYNTVVVDSVDPYNNVIYNKYEFDGALKKIDLKEKSDSKYEIYKDELAVEISDISPYDVLSVAKSKNDQVVTVYISQKTVTGKVEAMDADKETLTIGAKKYCRTDEFNKFAAGKKLSVGKETNMYLDVFGNCAYFKNLPDMDYCVLIKAYTDDSGDGYYLRYMNLDEEWKDSMLADKIAYNGDSVSAKTAYATLQYMQPQVVILKENAKEEITSIETASVTTQSIDDDFTVTPAAAMNYKKRFRGFMQSNVYKYYFEDDAKCVIIPDNYTNDRSKYYVRDASSYFTVDADATVAAYDMDEYGFTSLLKVTLSDDLLKKRINKNFFVVERVMQVVNSSGSVTSGVSGHIGMYRDFTLTGEQEETFSDIKAGDIINVSFDTNGNVDMAQKITSLNGDFKPMSVSNYYATHSNIAGTVESVSVADKRIKINVGSGTTVSLRIPDDLAVMKFYTRTDECDYTDASSLIEGSEVVVHLELGTISEVVMVDRN